jgi:hypothetical protein
MRWPRFRFVRAHLNSVLQHDQAMKFDTEGDDPMIVADTRRLEGNRQFQAKKYRWAVEAYTQGNATPTFTLT